MVQLGIQWTCNYLATLSQLVDYAVVLHYVLFALSGLVGVSLFSAFFLCRQEARAAWHACCSKRLRSRTHRVAGKNSTTATGVAKGEREYSLVGDKRRRGDGRVQGSDRECMLQPDSSSTATAATIVTPVQGHRVPADPDGDVGLHVPDTCSAYRVLPDNHISPGRGREGGDGRGGRGGHGGQGGTGRTHGRPPSQGRTSMKSHGGKTNHIYRPRPHLVEANTALRQDEHDTLMQSRI